MGDGNHRLIIDSGRHDAQVLQLCLSAVSLGCAFDNSFHPFLKGFPHLIAEAAGGSCLIAVLRHYIPTGARLDRPYGNDRRVHRRDLPADDGLQVIDDGSRYNSCVHTPLRLCAVAPLSLHSDMEFVCRRHPGAGFQRNHAGLHICPHMNGKTCVHTVQSALLNHGLGTQSYLLRRLESQFYRAAQFFFHVMKDAGSGQEHRNMAVMAAGMHNALVFARIRRPGGFLNRQGIHISAKQNGLAGLCALNGDQHTRLQPTGPPGNAYLVQRLFDCLAGVIFLGADFRMLMEIAALFDQILSVLGGDLLHIHNNSPFLANFFALNG